MKKLIVFSFMLHVGLFMSTIYAKTAKPIVVSDPYVEYTNNATIFIKSVELHPDSTVLYIKAFSVPHSWINIVSGTILITDDQSYKITNANGIDIDNGICMPSSGEAEFTLTFEPLPLDTRVFDFKEDDSEGSFCLRGIHTDKTFDNAPIDKSRIEAPRWEKGLYQVLALKTFLTPHLFLHTGYMLKDFNEPKNLMLGIGYRF